MKCVDCQSSIDPEYARRIRHLLQLPPAHPSRRCERCTTKALLAAIEAKEVETDPSDGALDAGRIQEGTVA